MWGQERGKLSFFPTRGLPANVPRRQGVGLAAKNPRGADNFRGGSAHQIYRGVAGKYSKGGEKGPTLLLDTSDGLGEIWSNDRTGGETNEIAESLKATII